MDNLIIYKSVHHGNTKKIAEVIGDVLEADLKDLKDIDPSSILKYDLIGFGSGIFYGKPHKKLVNFVECLDNVENKKAYVFSTNGRGRLKYNEFLKNRLSDKGFEIIGEFTCKGLDTVGPFKLIGGLNKGRPNEEDLKKAREFAEGIKKKIS